MFRRHPQVNIAPMALALFLVWLSGCDKSSQTSAPTNDTQFVLRELTIDALREGMESGRFSAVSITQAYLDRINQIDKHINSVLEINPDALAIARALDEERAQGKVRSPMHGIPVLIKDNIDTADKMLTTAGSLALVDAPRPKQDAFVVNQLRDAGAIILGKTNLSEWANFRSNYSSSGWSSRGGQTRNPYILDRTPCGSSSGSAAAVTASLTAVAVGTETDGSIICPAANNGIVGIKPTLGLISRRGIIPIAHSQDTAGPMARTVKDAVILLDVMVAMDPNDDEAPEAKSVVNNYSQFLQADALRGKRIGVVRQTFGRNARVDQLMEQKLELFNQAGATLIDVEFAQLGDIGAHEYQVLLYEFKHDLNQYLQRRGGATTDLQQLIAFNNLHADSVMPFFGQDIIEQAEAKGGLNQDEYQNALAASKRMSQTEGIDQVMAQYNLDALVAPSNGMGWHIDLINGDNPGAYVSSSTLAAVAGYPSITVPAGFIQELPIGLSFFGRAFSEPILIAMAYDFEQRNQGRQPPKFIASFESSM